jgi:hypothetical protein
MVEPVTPTDGVIGVACEEDARCASFFDGSTTEGFLRTDES